MIKISIQTIRHLVKSAINQNENHQVPNIKTFYITIINIFAFSKSKVIRQNTISTVFIIVLLQIQILYK